MKKIIFPLAVAILSTSVIRADDANMDMRMRKMEHEIDTMKRQKGGGASCCINPPARPDVNCGADLFITGEALYWKATQRGMTYAVDGNFSTSNGADSFTHGKAAHPHFQWDWGFRVGLGYNTPHDGWDLYATWTRFTTHAHNSVDTGGASSVAVPGDRIYPFFISQVVGDDRQSLSSASSRWRLRLNLIDLELGREFFVSRWMTLRPFIGFRAAWDHQRDRLHYVNLADPSPTDWVLNLKNRFFGFGIRGGLNTQWTLGCGWSLYGNGALSLLDGHFRAKFNQSNDDVDGNINPFNVRNHEHSATAMADWTVGLRYDTLFGCDDDYHFAAWAGYEQHVFFEQNQFMNFMYDEAGSDEGGGTFFTDGASLATHGLTLGLEFGF